MEPNTPLRLSQPLDRHIGLLDAARVEAQTEAAHDGHQGDTERVERLGVVREGHQVEATRVEGFLVRAQLSCAGIPMEP
eukprot:1332758-Prymnesium_polylepis.2